MKACFMFTITGPLVVLTSYDSINNPALLERWKAKGLTKFIAHEVSLESAEFKCEKRFDIVCQDLRESDDWRVLNYSGERAFRN
jgi:hypothetical protein